MYAVLDAIVWNDSGANSPEAKKGKYTFMYISKHEQNLESMLSQLRLMYRQNIALSKKCTMSIDGSSERCECYVHVLYVITGAVTVQHAK